MEFKKFSLAYKIVSVTPAHVYFDIWAGMILSEYDHHQVSSRGRCGDTQCMTCEEFRLFVDRSQPHLIFCEDTENLKKYTGLELL